MTRTKGIATPSFSLALFWNVLFSESLYLQKSAKAGLTLRATFNYQVIPEVSTEICYKQSRIRMKNCIGVYHQWTNNMLELYAWYAKRGWCSWRVSPSSTGSVSLFEL